jgi:hypothetical protein
MTTEQRWLRAKFVQEQPWFWLFVLYSVAYLSMCVIFDVLQLAGMDTASNPFKRYVFPLIIAWPLWYLLRQSTRHTLRQRPDGAFSREPSSQPGPPPVDQRITLRCSESSPGSSYSGCP